MADPTLPRCPVTRILGLFRGATMALNAAFLDSRRRWECGHVISNRRKAARSVPIVEKRVAAAILLTSVSVSPTSHFRPSPTPTLVQKPEHATEDYREDLGGSGAEIEGLATH